jgi:phosphoglucosamine mutase
VASELRSAVDEYIAHAIAALEGRTLAGLRVVIDCANGATFRTAPRVLEALGADLTVLHAAPDGTNINAACGSMHPDDVREAVVRTSAHAGLAFDGDGDRVIAVDEHGETVDGDQIMAILAIDFHEHGRLRNNAIAATVMSNLGLRRALADHGLDMIDTPVGDRHVLDALEEHDLVLGGEQSGHVVIRDLATTGDGLLTGLCVLDVIFRNRRRLSHLASVVKRYPQALRNVRVVDREALDRDRRFWHAAREMAEQLGDEGRVLVRPSGTEPMVRVMVEAPSATQADEIADWLAAAVQDACGAAAGPP